MFTKLKRLIYQLKARNLSKTQVVVPTNTDSHIYPWYYDAKN